MKQTKKPKLMMNGHTDEIYTPEYALNPLLPFLKDGWRIWECALEGIKRGTLFKKYGLQLIIPNRRINFITPNRGSSSWFATAWFTWGLNLPKDIMFVELNRDDVLPNKLGCII